MKAKYAYMEIYHGFVMNVKKKAERHRTPFQTLLNFPHLPE